MKCECFILLVTLVIIMYHEFTNLEKQKNKYRELYEPELDLDSYFGRKPSNDHIFVTYYYPVKTGKQRHTVEEYAARMERFFDIVKLPTIFYTQRRYLKQMNITSIPENIVINETYDSPYEICNLEKYRIQYKKIEILMNKTVGYAVTDVFGAIWNAKTCLVKEVLGYTNYSYGHWIDIGMFKDNQYVGQKFNDTTRMDKIFTKIRDKILFGAIAQLSSFKVVPFEEYNINATDYFTGGYFGGSRKAINNFCKEVFIYHDYFLKKSQYVLREEFIYSAYCLYNPKNCSFIKMGGNGCLYWHSTIGFLFASNPCKFPPYVNYYDYWYSKNKKKNEKFITEYSEHL